MDVLHFIAENSIYIFAMIFILSIIGFIVVKMMTKSTKYNNISNSGAAVNPPVDIYLFYATWCPHCKNILPKWNSFSETVNGTIVNGSMINIHTIDSTDMKNPDVVHNLNTYNITEFPTIKGVKGDTIVNFDAKINENTLQQFVQEMTSA